MIQRSWYLQPLCSEAGVRTHPTATDSLAEGGAVHGVWTRAVKLLLNLIENSYCMGLWAEAPCTLGAELGLQAQELSSSVLTF